MPINVIIYLAGSLCDIGLFGFFLRIFGTDKGYRKLKAMKSSEDDAMNKKV